MEIINPMIEVTMYNPGNWGMEEINGLWPSNPSKYIKWTTEYRDIGVWVDWWNGVAESNHKYKIGVLMEPISLCPHNYNTVENLLDHFDLIFTHYESDLTKHPKYKYNIGGYRSYISPEDWKIYPKTNNIVSVVSNQNILEGHKLRHTIKNHINNPSHLSTYNTVHYLNPPTKRKVDALKDYRFELVIDNEDADFFSEKILDSMLCGCIPIYWNVKTKRHLKIFDLDGIVFFDNTETLYSMISSGYFNEDLYNSKLNAIKYNFEKAKEFVSLGDILWNAGLKDFLTINNQI